MVSCTISLPPSMPNPGLPAISPCATGDVVRRLQRALRRTPNLGLTIYGIFDSQTETYLLAGGSLPTAQCWICHGQLGQPESAISRGMYPPPLLSPEQSVTDDPVWARHS